MREAGFKLTRLLPENGDIWEQAEALNRQVDKWRIGLLSPDGNPKPVPGTVAALAAAYQESVDFLDLAEKTRVGYKSGLKILCAIGDQKHPFGRESVSGITPPVVQLVKKTLRARGAYQANAVLTTARLTWAWGIRNGKATANPWADPRKFRVKPRDQIWTAAHRAGFKAKALELGFPSLTGALDLLLYTVQRPQDVVKMGRTHYRKGLLRIRQQKTGTIVHVPPPEPLRRFLAGLPRGRVLFLVNEAGRAFTVDSLARRFREVLDELEAEDPEGGWDELQVRDTRRTGVVALAEADCTIPQITAISGHDTEECQRIIDTYLPRTVPMAKEAVRKWNRKLKEKPA